MITVLGASGSVGGQLAEILIQKREEVTLVARGIDRLRKFSRKNVHILAGDAQDTAFLVTAFKGSDAAFVLIPPNPTAAQFLPYADTIGESISRAIEKAKVKYVVNLSSVGAELKEGTGPIVALHNQEERLNRVRGLHVLHLRSAYFMENLLGNIDLIKLKGITGSAMRGDLRFPMIATRDIAGYVADRITKKDFAGSTVRYLLGEGDRSMIEAAEIIGRKIGKPGLSYVMFPYDEAEKGMIAKGLSPDMSGLYVEMSRAFNDGKIVSENRTGENTTSTSLEMFCDEVFVPGYSHAKAA